MPKPQARTSHLTHPAPEALIPHALGVDDPSVARHVPNCPTCRAEVGRLRRSADVLRRQRVFDRPAATAECLDEPTVADALDGRLDPEVRAPVIAHLLTCAHCRSMIVGTSRAVADATLAPTTVRRWRRWSLPLGAAAAAAVLLLFLPPRRGTDHGGLREPPPSPTSTGAVAPVPIAPRDSVATVDRFVWSSLSGVDRYRLRLYDAEGGVKWTTETADTVVARPDSVVLSPRVTYFWKVEAQTEWQRWVASDLIEFRLTGHGP